MTRSALALRWIGLTGFVACLAAVAWILLAPAGADAQVASDPSFTLAVSDLADDTETRTAAIGFDPAESNVSAVTAHFSYDADKVHVIDCSVSEAGACNDVGGVVKFSVFNLSGLDANKQLLTVDFAPADGASGTTTFELTIATAVNNAAEPVAHNAPEPVDVVIAVPSESKGSITGDITEAGTEIGVFGLDVCATDPTSEASRCARTNGWGAWRIDDLVAGDYVVTITDPNGVYTSAAMVATVVATEVTAGYDAVVEVDTGDDAADDATTDDDTEAATDDDTEAATDPALLAYLEARKNAVELAPKTVVYGATISGRVVDRVTRAPLAGVQVCATQPLVLHQSCASAAADGTYVLDGLSTGNYWITVVDPLSRYDETTGRLVGVTSDDAQRTGVTISLIGR